MRNRYKGICYVCGKTVEINEGHFERDFKNKKWKIKHAKCVNPIRNNGEVRDMNNIKNKL